MAAIFHIVSGEWCAERLVTKHAVLSFVPVHIASLKAPTSYHRNDSIELMRLESGRKWIAIVPKGSQITHNGQRVAAGLRVLAHGDLLAAAHGAAVFFSTEEAPCIETFTGTESVPC